MIHDFALKVLSDLTANGGENRFAKPEEESYILWDENGQATAAATKCSSFVTIITKRFLDWDDKQFAKVFGAVSPYAATYAEAIVNESLQQVYRVSDLRPGIFLSIDFDGQYNDNGFTGHSAFLISKPRKQALPFGNYESHEIDVVDCTSQGHGVNDQRPFGGIGIATMRLLCQGEAIHGYTWSTDFSSPMMINGQGQELRFAIFPTKE